MPNLRVILLIMMLAIGTLPTFGPVKAAAINNGNPSYLLTGISLTPSAPGLTAATTTQNRKYPFMLNAQEQDLPIISI